MKFLKIPDWIIKWAFSKSGILLRHFVSWLIGVLAGYHIFAQSDLNSIQMGLLSGGYAVIAIFYGLINLYLNGQHSQEDKIKDMQASVGVKETGKLDEETVSKLYTHNGVPVNRSVNMQLRQFYKRSEG